MFFFVFRDLLNKNSKKKYEGQGKKVDLKLAK
jgi:hypothetical protein